MSKLNVTISMRAASNANGVVGMLFRDPVPRDSINANVPGHSRPVNRPSKEAFLNKVVVSSAGDRDRRDSLRR